MSHERNQEVECSFTLVRVVEFSFLYSCFFVSRASESFMLFREKHKSIHSGSFYPKLTLNGCNLKAFVSLLANIEPNCIQTCIQHENVLFILTSFKLLYLGYKYELMDGKQSYLFRFPLIFDFFFRGRGISIFP